MIETMFKTGAHYGLVTAARHPTAKPFIFGKKNNFELIDLEKTAAELERAQEFVKGLASRGKMILFVGSKAEARASVERVAKELGMPYVAGRFMGGTLTNFSEIKKRIHKFEDLSAKKASGDLSKYTKREQGMIAKEIDELNEDFGGLVPLTRLPDAVFIVDAKHELIALKEANTLGIPVISLSSTDADFDAIQYPIPANDSSRQSIDFFLNALAEAYTAGKS